MPPNLPAIFGSTASTSEELQAFKSELLHAFHCRAPSCPISGCNALSTKLQRLQVHLQTCREETCLLCSIGSYLRTYNNAVAAPAGADGGVCAPCGPTAGASAGSSDPLSLGGGMSPLYVNELLASRQRLPCYDRETGKVSWMNPRDALESIRHMSGGFPMPPGAAGAPSAADLLGSSGFDGDPLAKRQRRDGGGGSGSHSDSVLSALGAYPGLHQGVLGGGPGGSGAGAFGGLGLPNFGAGGSMADAYAAHQGSQQGAMPRVPDENGKRSGGGGGGNGSRDFASMAAEMVQGIGGMYEPLGANFGAKRPHSMTGGGSEGNYENGYPMPAGLMSSLAGLPMSQAKSRSFGLGLSSSNLQELIKSTSLSDLGLGLGLNRSYSGGLGASMADLGSDLGLSLAKSRSELKDANSSNFSLSGLLGEGAHDIVSGLALGRSKSNLGLDVNGAGGGAGGRSDGLADIMGDFGGGGAAASASTPQISAK